MAAPGTSIPNPVLHSDSAPAAGGDPRAPETEIREDNRDLRHDLRGAPNPHARQPAERAAQHLAPEIDESGQRLVASIGGLGAPVGEQIAASEKRVRAAIAEVLGRTGQFEAHNAETNEGISRGGVRQRWRDRIVLLLYLLAAEILGRFVPLC